MFDSFSLSDVWERDLVELVLEVSVSQVSHRQHDMLLRQVGVLLGVLDSDIIVREISAFNEHRFVFITFCVFMLFSYIMCCSLYVFIGIQTPINRTQCLNGFVGSIVCLITGVHLSSALVWSSWCQEVRGAPLCPAAASHLVYATSCASRRMTFSSSRPDEWIQSVSI